MCDRTCKLSLWDYEAGKFRVQRGASRSFTSALILSYKCARQRFSQSVFTAFRWLGAFLYFEAISTEVLLAIFWRWPSHSINASSEGQQFHNFSGTLPQFKKEEKRFFLFTIKGSVLPGIYICTMDVFSKHKRSFLSFIPLATRLTDETSTMLLGMSEYNPQNDALKVWTYTVTARNAW